MPREKPPSEAAGRDPAGRSPRRRLVTLHFEVPFEFRQQCKVYAARHGMTMTQLLIWAFRQAGIVQAQSEVEDSREH